MDLKILLEQVPDGDGTWLMSLVSGLKFTMIVADSFTPFSEVSASMLIRSSRAPLERWKWATGSRARRPLPPPSTSR